VTRVRTALVLGVGVTLVAVVVVIAQFPLTVIAENNAAGMETELGSTKMIDARICQGGETIPRGTVAIRFSLYALTGPPLEVRALHDGRTVRVGTRGSGWTGASVTIPVAEITRSVSPVTLCLAATTAAEPMLILGRRTGAGAAAYREPGHVGDGRMKIAYLGRGHSSWMSLALSVARHMGLGRAWSGTWVAALVLALMLAALGVVAALVLGEIDAPRLPFAAWMCALVAILNAASWSFIVPPFQVTDEPDHVAYVKQLAETGTRPHRSAPDTYGREEVYALRALRYDRIRLRPGTRAIFSEAEQRALEVGLRAHRASVSSRTGNAGTASAEPPLYYALESIPYTLDLSGTLLERVQLMRLFSALMGGLTALFTFLFLRETLPKVRWAWTVGTLGVALSPMFATMSGAVNPDAMLFAVSAVIFYCLARAFRRGLTARSAVATGAAVAAGFATKLSFLGLAPGVFFALGILAARGWRDRGRRGLRAPAFAVTLAALPPMAYIVAEVSTSRHRFAFASSLIHDLHGSLLHRANYIWQLYLPRLPGTRNDFPGLFTARQVWFDGYVGKFGWLDTAFPGWVYMVALVVAVAIACLFLRELIGSRASLRARAGELVAYALMSLGMMVLIGLCSYLVYPGKLAEYGQIRYLLPLLPLLGAIFALAARGAGWRWGSTAATLIVVLFFAQDIFGQLQTIARFYG
jgi:hypothetical protein